MYLFAITAGAVFVVAATLLSRPPEVRPARVVIAANATLPSDPSLGFAFAEQRIKHRENLLAAAQAVELDRALPDEAETLAHLRRHLSAATSFGSDGTPRLEIAYAGNSPWGAGLVNELARRYVEHDHAQRVADAAEQQRRTGQDLDEARARVAAAQRDLERFLSDHFNFAGHEEERPEPTDMGEPQINPRWLELTETIESLKVERSEALGQITPAHPIVQELDSRIEQFAAQLADTPRHRTTGATGLPLGEKPRRAATALGADQTPESKLYEQLQARQRQALAVQERTEALDQRARQALAKEKNQRLRIVARAEAQTETSRTSAAAGLALLVALVCGGSMAVRGVPADPTFRNIAEVEQNLPLPLVAVLPAKEPASALPQCLLPGWSRGIKRVAEFMLVLFVCCLVVLLIADAAFFRRLASEPWQFFSGSLWRAIELWRA